MNWGRMPILEWEEYSRQSEEQLQKVAITHEHESLESWKQFCVTGAWPGEIKPLRWAEARTLGGEESRKFSPHLTVLQATEYALTQFS